MTGIVQVALILAVAILPWALAGWIDKITRPRP